MNSRTTRAFWKHFDALPPDVRDQAKKAFRLWRQDTSHPGLQFKRIHSSEQIHAVRVSGGYRALGLRDGDTVTWFWVGSHAAYERLIR